MPSSRTLKMPVGMTRSRLRRRDMALKRFLMLHYDIKMMILTFIYTRPSRINDRDDAHSHLGCDNCLLSGTFMIRLIIQEDRYRVDEECLPEGWWSEPQLPIKQSHPPRWKEYDPDICQFFCSMSCHRDRYACTQIDNIAPYESSWRRIVLYKSRVFGLEPSRNFEMW